MLQTTVWQVQNIVRSLPGVPLISGSFTSFSSFLVFSSASSFSHFSWLSLLTSNLSSFFITSSASLSSYLNDEMGDYYPVRHLMIPNNTKIHHYEICFENTPFMLFCNKLLMKRIKRKYWQLKFAHCCYLFFKLVASLSASSIAFMDFLVPIISL